MLLNEVNVEEILTGRLIPNVQRENVVIDEFKERVDIMVKILETGPFVARQLDSEETRKLVDIEQLIGTLSDEFDNEYIYYLVGEEKILIYRFFKVIGQYRGLRLVLLHEHLSEIKEILEGIQALFVHKKILIDALKEITRLRIEGTKEVLKERCSDEIEYREVFVKTLLNYVTDEGLMCMSISTLKHIENSEVCPIAGYPKDIDKDIKYLEDNVAKRLVKDEMRNIILNTVKYEDMIEILKWWI